MVDRWWTENDGKRKLKVGFTDKTAQWFLDPDATDYLIFLDLSGEVQPCANAAM